MPENSGRGIRPHDNARAYKSQRPDSQNGNQSGSESKNGSAQRAPPGAPLDKLARRFDGPGKRPTNWPRLYSTTGPGCDIIGAQAFMMHFFQADHRPRGGKPGVTSSPLFLSDYVPLLKRPPDLTRGPFCVLCANCGPFCAFQHKARGLICKNVAKMQMTFQIPPEHFQKRSLFGSLQPPGGHTTGPGAQDQRQPGGGRWQPAQF